MALFLAYCHLSFSQRYQSFEISLEHHPHPYARCDSFCFRLPPESTTLYNDHYGLFTLSPFTISNLGGDGIVLSFYLHSTWHYVLPREDAHYLSVGEDWIDSNYCIYSGIRHWARRLLCFTFRRATGTQSSCLTLWKSAQWPETIVTCPASLGDTPNQWSMILSNIKSCQKWSGEKYPPCKQIKLSTYFLFHAHYLCFPRKLDFKNLYEKQLLFYSSGITIHPVLPMAPANASKGIQQRATFLYSLWFVLSASCNFHPHRRAKCCVELIKHYNYPWAMAQKQRENLTHVWL